MTSNSGVKRDRSHFSWTASTVCLTGVALFVGFLLIETPVAARVFGYVAHFLSICASGILRLAGYDIVRNGTELRDAVSGHAIAVTSACDGSGLTVSLAGAIVWLRSSTSQLNKPIRILATALVAISAFNLIRILVLFQSIAMPEAMHLEHLYIAPLLSVLLVAGLALYARRLSPDSILGSTGQWLGFATVTAVIWYLLGSRVTCLAIVPTTNALIAAMPDMLTQSISCSGVEATLVTSAIISLEPPTFATAPFYPADFALAVPAIAASLALRRSAAIVVSGAVLSILLFSVAMTLGAITTAYDEATAAGLRILLADGVVQPYRPPAALGVLKVVQNMIVHFNLFILPIALTQSRRTVSPILVPTTARTRRKQQRARR